MQINRIKVFLFLLKTIVTFLSDNPVSACALAHPFYGVNLPPLTSGWWFFLIIFILKWLKTKKTQPTNISHFSLNNSWIQIDKISWWYYLLMINFHSFTLCKKVVLSIKCQNPAIRIPRWHLFCVRINSKRETTFVDYKIPDQLFSGFK